MYEIMTKHYMEAKMAADTGRKTAWITSGAPVELCHTFDIIPLYPENHAAMCGADRMAVELCIAAEERGFSRDLCSYARTDFGQILTGRSPIAGLPKPDLLLCCNNICGTVTKWYQELHRQFGVPLVYIDAPYLYEHKTDAMVKYVSGQLRRAIGEIGDVVGNRFDPDMFDSVVDLSRQAAQLWKEILSLLKHRPAPMNLFDAFIHMAPIVIGRGTQECVDYYVMLRDEIAERVESGVASIPGERFRLGWDNLAIWYKLRALSERFGERHAALVVSPYTTGFAAYDRSISYTDPLDEMAATYLGRYINSGLKAREQLLLELVKDYSLDGYVMHSNRSCKPYSIGMYDIARSLTERHGIPTVVIEADHNDSRQYSEEQINTRIDAFIETIENRSVAVDSGSRG